MKPKKTMNYRTFSCMAMTACCMLSCSTAFLDVKPRSTLIVPHTLTDFQQLLDNAPILYASSELNEVMADDYYLTTAYWKSLSSPVLRNAHIWADNAYEAVASEPSWNYHYQQIFYANVVLDGLGSIPESESGWDYIAGQAYFIRAYAMYNLVQLFAAPYNGQTAASLPGLPYPLVADVNRNWGKGTLESVFSRMLEDVSEAASRLPAAHDYSRASRPAAHALAARILLLTGRYDEAAAEADRCLGLYSHLSDLNDGHSRHYTESIYLGRVFPAPRLMITVNANVFVNPELYDSYSEHDLRKSAYFRLNAAGQAVRRPLHGLGATYFTGLDTDEVFLVRAECAVRTGDVSQAHADLNYLLEHRMDRDYFTPVSESDPGRLLILIMEERRRELPFRNIRWTDLRRLQLTSSGTVLERELDGEVYTLEAGSGKWTFPIPPDEIALGSIEQNER